MTTARQHVEWGLSIKQRGQSIDGIPHIRWYLSSENFLPTGSITNPRRFSVYRYLQGLRMESTVYLHNAVKIITTEQQTMENGASSWRERSQRKKLMISPSGYTRDQKMFRLQVPHPPDKSFPCPSSDYFVHDEKRCLILLDVGFNFC